MSYAGSIGKRAALWALAGLAALVQPAGAIPRPECSPAVFGAWVAPPAQAGQEAPVGAVALYTSGSWPDGEAPAEVRVRHALSGEEQLLAFVGEASERRSGSQQRGLLFWYRTDGSELAAGYWKLLQPEVVGGFHVSGEVSDELSAEVDAVASVYSGWWPSTNPRQQGLSIGIYVPDAWEERLPGSMLLGVRLGVDAPPDATFMSEGDLYTLASSEGWVDVTPPFWATCLDAISVDWYDGSVVYGLIWPLGLDPAKVSLRFELSLEGFREQADELARMVAEGPDTGAVDAGSRPPEDARGDASSSEDTWVPGPEDADLGLEPADAKQDVSAPKTSTASCAASRPSSGTAWVATAGLALLVLGRRRRSVP